MKIAFILPSLGNNGPILIAKYLITNLIKEHNVDVYYFDERIELDFPCPTIKINFIKAIEFNKYDIIHSHMLRPDLYIYFHRSKINSKTKTVTTLHQDSYKNLALDYNRFIALIVCKLWEKAQGKFDKIVALNKTVANKVNINKEKLIIIGNGIPLLMNNTKLTSKEKNTIEKFVSKFDHIIGSSSLLKKVKGLEQIIKVLQHYPKIGYIIVGDGPERKNLENLAVTLGVFDQCLFLGQRPNGIKYFKYFDIYMLTSYSEGFPICGIEAAQSKLPIVCSNIEVLQEIFEQDEVVFFEVNNIDSLNNAVSRALLDTERLSKNIDEKYHKNLSDIKMTNDYINLYKKLLSKTN